MATKVGKWHVSEYTCVFLKPGAFIGKGKGRVCGEPATCLVAPGNLAYCKEHEGVAREITKEGGRKLSLIAREKDG